MTIPIWSRTKEATVSEAHMKKIEDDLMTAELSRASHLSVENKALRDERDRLARVLEGLSSIIPHQHCRTCNQYADEIKAALAPAGGENETV